MEDIKQIKDQLVLDIQAEFLSKGRVLDKTPLLLNVILTVFSYYIYTFHSRHEKNKKNCFLNEVSDPAIIQRHLALYNMRQKQGTPATGTVTMKSTEQVTVDPSVFLTHTLPSGEVLLYVVEETITFNGQANVRIKSVENGGKYNLSAGSELVFQSPIVSLENEATIVTMTNGSDDENIYDAKERNLQRIRTRNTGGTLENYKSWVSDVNGVYAVKIYPHYPQPGKVTIHFVINSIEDFIPTTTKINEVVSTLNDNAPIGVDVVVNAPPTKTINISITNLVTDNDISTSHVNEVKNTITEDVKKFFLEKAFNTNKIIYSQLNQVISSATGEVSHNLAMNGGVVDIDLGDKEVAILGTLTW